MNSSEILTAVPRARTLDKVVPWAYGGALVLALLLLRQPYRGVRHDGVLYLGQALNHLHAPWLAVDVFFSHGSQDQFTLFSNLLAWLVSNFGINPSELGLLLLSRAGFIAAAYWLLDTLPPMRRWLGLVCIATLSHFYGMSRVFSVLEPFVTGRTLAEPFAVLALAALVHDRRLLAVLALAASMAMHPLIAVPVAIVGWFYLIAQDRRWLALLLLLVPMVLLGYAGIEPFHSLVVAYDDGWFRVVGTVNVNVFVSEWGKRDLTTAVWDCVMLFLAAGTLPAALKRVARSAFWAAVVLLPVSFLCVDLIHGVLMTQLQLWRVLWIVDLLLAVSLPGLVIAEWQRGPVGRLAAVAICAVAPGIEAWADYGWAQMLWAFAALALSRFQVQLKPGIVRLAMIATVLMGLVQAAQATFEIAYQVGMHSHGSAVTHFGSLPFCLPLFTIGLAAVLLFARQRGGRAAMVASVCVAGLFVGALLQFDQRTAWTRFIEAPGASIPPFEAAIPPGKNVYWEDFELAPTWLLMHRPSFASSSQFAGVLFNRPTAMVAIRRVPLIVPQVLRGERCSTLEGLSFRPDMHFGQCDVPEQEFFQVCAAPDHADFVVSHLRYTQPVAATWRFEGAEPGTPSTYYLYDCSKVQGVTLLPSLSEFAKPLSPPKP